MLFIIHMFLSVKDNETLRLLCQMHRRFFSNLDEIYIKDCFFDPGNQTSGKKMLYVIVNQSYLFLW